MHALFDDAGASTSRLLARLTLPAAALLTSAELATTDAFDIALRKLPTPLASETPSQRGQIMAVLGAAFCELTHVLHGAHSAHRLRAFVHGLLFEAKPELTLKPDWHHAFEPLEGESARNVLEALLQTLHGTRTDSWKADVPAMLLSLASRSREHLRGVEDSIYYTLQSTDEDHPELARFTPLALHVDDTLVATATGADSIGRAALLRIMEMAVDCEAHGQALDDIETRLRVASELPDNRMKDAAHVLARSRFQLDCLATLINTQQTLRAMWSQDGEGMSDKGFTGLGIVDLDGRPSATADADARCYDSSIDFYQHTELARHPHWLIAYAQARLAPWQARLAARLSTTELRKLAVEQSLDAQDTEMLRRLAQRAQDASDIALLYEMLREPTDLRTIGRYRQELEARWMRLLNTPA